MIDSKSSIIMAQSFAPRYPLDKNELGNASWKLLHSYAAQYPDNPTTEDKKEFHSLLRAVIRTIPEGDCKCRTHAVEYVQKNPPKMGNRKQLVESLCSFHNDVNTRSEKPTIDCGDLLKNTGDCPSCKIKPKEKVIVAADKDGPLKSVLGDYKQLSIKVFDELCKRENLPTPKIVFSPCPAPNEHTSCTKFLVNDDKTVIKEGEEGKAPIVYINPSNFGLRVLIHEWHEYQRQMKVSGHYIPKDEDTVEKHTKEIIHKYFPADSYDEKKDQVLQPMIMKDEIAVQQEEPKTYKNRFSTDEFPMFTKYRERQKQSGMESDEASKGKQGGLLSYFDALYEPFAKHMNLAARDLNLANTPNIFAEGSKIAINSQFTSMGSLLATSVLGLAFFIATALNRDGIGIADRQLLAQLGGQFLWSGLQNASSPTIKETAGQIGTYIANMELDQITPLLVNPDSVFAGMTAQQQRSQQRATGIGAGSPSVSGGVSPGGSGISQAMKERIQERAVNPNPQPESMGTFRNFPTGAGGYGLGTGAVPRIDSGGGHSFSYNPTPASPYDLPDEEKAYMAQLGIPTEPTESLPSRNLGMSMSLTDEELEALR